MASAERSFARFRHVGDQPALTVWLHDEKFHCTSLNTVVAEPATKDLTE